MSFSDQSALTRDAQCQHPFYGGPQLQDVCAANGSLVLLSMLNLYLAVNSKIGAPCQRIKPVARTDLVYDYIVIGAGAAGPTAAARLSEKYKVLLLEAGPDETGGMQVPSNLQLYLNTELDWKYKTTNEQFACLSTNGSCSFPRGRNLGGCTAHHGMAYHRGHKKDYDRWVEMGNDGWSWDDVIPVFKKAEDNREIGRVRAEDHGTGGPLTVERSPYQPQFAWDILAAAREVEFGTTEDLVGPNITGFTVAQLINRDGVRLSSSRAALWPARDRKNLHISVNSQATKIIIRNKNAVGVQYIKDGKTRTARARREVIVSAGAINSPQLLMLSGIGPKDHLKSVGIPVVQDLPGVGQNLHNHASYGLDFAIDLPKEDEVTVGTSDLYLANQTGPMSCTGLAQVTGILPSNYTTADDPDIQFFFAGFQAICPTDGRIADLAMDGDKETVRFTSVNVQTRSRGRLLLKDKNPTSHPDILSNELSDPQDVSVIIQGIRHLLKLAESAALRKYNLTLIDPPIQACSQYGSGTDEYYACAIRHNTRPENHQAGSCKMGPASDPMAVVDPELRVHNIKGLRVADASIMPKVVSGNPHATVTMIGDRVVDFIERDLAITSR